MRGLITCARYAFMPNHLGYCGPDENKNLLGYISQEAQDQGLKEILVDFQTLEPYLSFIARSNKIPDPFDQQVVEAYWIGNNFLETISLRQFYRYLNEDLALSKKMDKRSLHHVFGKLPLGAKPHHSFHVLNIFRRTGHLSINHTLETMDSCRINWGKVINRESDELLVHYRPLIIEDGRLKRGNPLKKKVICEIDGRYFASRVEINDIITFHWGAVCEKISPEKAHLLDYYTQQAIDLANLTL